MSDYALTALASLSLQRVGYRPTPRPLTNDQRMRAFRAIQPVTFANSHFTPARQQPQPLPNAGGAGNLSEVMK